MEIRPAAKCLVPAVGKEDRDSSMTSDFHRSQIAQCFMKNSCENSLINISLKADIQPCTLMDSGSGPEWNHWLQGSRERAFSPFAAPAANRAWRITWKILIIAQDAKED
jgi:hypothetical protein